MELILFLLFDTESLRWLTHILFIEIDFNEISKIESKQK